MRLTEIKLAGFKSFVDPTHIPVPGQLVGIVGPNGCGKSNIIDAVRWVLGESSAKHLRGETMQDVLFNGSGNRQPVNRASVELIFDNSLGKAGGQWSNFAEISVKRLLERDGDSTYDCSPVIDALVDQVINAPSREELIFRTHALDRVLLWRHYLVPNWGSREYKVAVWDRFGKDLPMLKPVTDSFSIRS